MVHNLHWQAAAIADLNDTGMPYAEIGKKYGRSGATIIKLARLHKLIRRVPISLNGTQKDSSKTVLSLRHRGLGLKVGLLRKGRTYSEVALELGVSRYVARTMELGIHEFTLSELMVLSDRLNMTFDQMLTPSQSTSSLTDTYGERAMLT